MTANILLINNGRILAEGDVHHIRPLLLPQANQLAARRQPGLQTGVARQRHAAHQRLGVTFFLQRHILLVLARADQMDAMPALAHAVHHAFHRDGHAIHFGRVGLAHHGDMQGCGELRSGGVVGCMHGRIISGAHDTGIKSA